MVYLLLVSLIWAFSFGLIKGNLTGLDPDFVAFVRLAISFIVFVPFLRIKDISKSFSLKLIITGSIQYGLMYISYIYSYQYLKAYEIALFTIFTPIYVSLINDLLTKKFHKLFFAVALLAFAGTLITLYREIDRQNFILGFLLVQISNLCFAFGQIYYKKILAGKPQIKDLNIYALLFLGGVILTMVFSIFTTKFSTLTITNPQLFTLVYLGVIASGLGFFLWNYGARRTNTGSLAIFNNLKIPLAIAVSLIFFGESADVLRLIIGSIIILFALFINEKFVSGKTI